ncbi:MAG TPA: FHA domain-containing protein [Thermoanaerobaculia bacterium]|nr:FHA domain-containing protein [Thermoanaerobaculia bacterium]
MPLIRCPKCGQSYDVPGVIAVRLPSSIATCQCGEWLSGSKAAVLARLVDVNQIREIDLKPYRVSSEAAAPPPSQDEPTLAPSAPRSVRIVARGAKESVDLVFTIHEHPLWIGRKGCHVELAEAELSIRHCSISVQGDTLVVRDADSHMGTFLDGQQIDEAAIGDGVHLLRVGSALVSVEPTSEAGLPVEPITLDSASVVDESVLAEKMRAMRTTQPAAASRVVLICVEGLLAGQEFEIPSGGALVVGREGHVRVPDEFLSRRHFEVARDADGTVRVRDLGSRNGTFLNTLPARNTKVHGGDEIRAGVNRFKIEQRA